MAVVLHILDRLSAAGPTRSLISLAALQREAGAPWQHRVVTLQAELYPHALLMARRAGLQVRRAVDAAELAEEIAQADIVQLHYWNNPAFLDLLGRRLPPHRRILWFMVAGGSPRRPSRKIWRPAPISAWRRPPAPCACPPFSACANRAGLS